MLRSFNNSVILRLIASDDVIYNNAPWMEFRFSNTSLCIDVNSLFNLIVLLFFTLGLHSCLCGQFVQSCIHFFGPSVLITFHMLRHFKYKFFFVWTYYILKLTALYGLVLYFSFLVSFSNIVNFINFSIPCCSQYK